MQDDRKRAFERHELRDPASGEVKVYHSMAIRQLSLGGALIEVAVPLQLNSLHDFRLTLGERSVVVKARVVHSHISTVATAGVAYQTGVEFVELSDPVAEALEAFVAALKGHGGAPPSR